MQSQIQRVNTSGLFRVGVVVFLLALVALGVQQFFGAEATATTASQPADVSAQAQAAITDTAFKPQAQAGNASTLDALLSEAAALTGMPEIGSMTEAAIETRWGAQSYTNGAVTCEYSILDALGLANCQATTERFMEACRSFYSKSHCATRMQPGMEQAPTSYRQASQPQAVGMAQPANPYPNRPLNYVPDHWSPGIRAALQYPSGLMMQRWANENLYPGGR